MGVQHPYDGVKAAAVEYDFAKDGGAIGTITLRPLGQHGGAIPADAIIVRGLIYVQTVLTSGGAATVALQSEAAGDLLAASAISGAPWSTTGQKAAIPVGAATAVRLTAERSLKMVVAAAALTAGKFRLYVEYL